jgi:oligopeptide transport system ATP-binding protein
MTAPLLKVEGLGVDFGAHSALRDVSFEMEAAQTLGLVGESGAGKSTLARAILRLLKVTRGRIEFRGLDLCACPPDELRSQRRDLQIIFQDPLASLDPRMCVGDAIGEPLDIFEPRLTAGQRRARIGAMLERVGLSAAMAGRYPHEFSGGQAQRIGIARAMILNPKLLICDEPVSSLDVSIQGQILNLLHDMQQDTGMAMLFISHNLAVVRHLSHRILVIYRGRLVEVAMRDALFSAPVHPYTRELLAAGRMVQVPRTASVATAQAGVAAREARSPAMQAASSATSTVGASAVDPVDLPPGVRTPGSEKRPLDSGCAFRDRCAYALAACAATIPPLQEITAGHWVACHRSHEALNPLSLPP